MKKIILFLFLTHCESDLYALSDTTRKSPNISNNHKVIFSYTYQRYYDNKSIVNDALPPHKHVYANNTTCYYYSIQYEYITRYMLSLTVGFDYGLRKYDIGIDQDISNFDSTATHNLAGKRFKRQIPVSVTYIAPRMLIGYKLPLRKKWSIHAKAGSTLKLFFDGLNKGDMDFRNFAEYIDASGTPTKYQIGYIESKLGRQKSLVNSRRYFPNKILSQELYLGTNYELSGTWLTVISIGFEGTSNWSKWDKYGTGALVVYSKAKAGASVPTSEDFFVDRNISIGLRIGIGF